MCRPIISFWIDVFRVDILFGMFFRAIRVSARRQDDRDHSRSERDRPQIFDMRLAERHRPYRGTAEIWRAPARSNRGRSGRHTRRDVVT